jgi:hypothetical protein
MRGLVVGVVLVAEPEEECLLGAEVPPLRPLYVVDSLLCDARWAEIGVTPDVVADVDAREGEAPTEEDPATARDGGV